MNTPYDFTESAALIEKLVGLTRDGKIEWTRKKTFGFPGAGQYHTTLDGDLEALVWSTNRDAGFRIFEKAPEPRMYPPQGVIYTSNPDVPFVPAQPPPISERDLVSISIDHDHGAAQGAIYVMLMALLELARRSEDKIEPKIDRVKQYLDKLAV